MNSDQTQFTGCAPPFGVLCRCMRMHQIGVAIEVWNPILSDSGDSILLAREASRWTLGIVIFTLETPQLVIPLITAILLFSRWIVPSLAWSCLKMSITCMGMRHLSILSGRYSQLHRFLQREAHFHSTEHHIQHKPRKTKHKVLRSFTPRSWITKLQVSILLSHFYSPTSAVKWVLQCCNTSTGCRLI